MTTRTPRPATTTRFAAAAFFAAVAAFALAPAVRAGEPLYATYLGGSDVDDVSFVLARPGGGTIVLGWTVSADFPGTRPFPEHGGGGDVFVTSYDRDGVVVYSVVMGGSQTETVSVCRLGANGDVTVLGKTNSTDFGTLNAFQPKPAGGGGGDCFVFRLDASGAVVFSTYVGSDDLDDLRVLEVDDAGNTYVSGSVNASGYTTTRHALSRHFNTRKPFVNPGPDGVLTKLDPTGRVIYSTYISGRQAEGVGEIRPLADGSVVVLGATNSDNFKTLGSAQRRLADHTDVFVMRFGPGGELVFSQLLGGSGTDVPSRSVMRDDGSVVIWGDTDSPDLPVKDAFQPTIAHRGSFVARFDGSGARDYVTYVGCVQASSSLASLAVDGAGNAYLRGYAAPAYRDDFPLVAPFDAEAEGFAEATLTKLAPDGTCVYSTWVGGSNDEGVTAMYVDSEENVTLVGATLSTDFPTAGANARRFSGQTDAFVTKVDRAGRLVFSTCFGGSGTDEPLHSAASSAGDVFLLGRTESSDFPTTSGSFPRVRYKEGFVAKVGADGRVAFSTLLGANVDDGSLTARVVPLPNGGVVVASDVDSFQAGTFHQVDPLPSDDGIDDAMVAAVAPDGRRTLATFLGGSGGDRLRTLFVDDLGTATLSLLTRSPDMPARDAAQPGYGGLDDLWLVSFAP